MSWQTALAQTYSDTADFLEDATNGLYKKMTDAGWTLHDDLIATSGQTDKVFKSVGEDGTEVIYIRITQIVSTQRIRFGAYTFWDASGHAGHNEVRGGISYDSHTDWPHCCAGSASSFIGWIVANKDGVTFAHKLSTYYSMAHFGRVTTRLIPANQAGRTTLTSGVTIAASGTTNLAVASESNILAGQKVWIINQATTAGGTMLRCTVTATASGQITVSNDIGTATTFDAGALVGFDPQPIMLPIGYHDGTRTRSCPQKGHTTLYRMFDKRKTGSAQAYADHARFGLFYPYTHNMLGDTAPNGTLFFDPTIGGMRPRNDPDLLSRFVLFPYTFLDGWTDSPSAPEEGIYRGYTDRLCHVPKGSTLANEDTVTVGATTQWLILDTASPIGDSYDYLMTAMKIAE